MPLQAELSIQKILLCIATWHQTEVQLQ